MIASMTKGCLGDSGRTRRTLTTRRHQPLLQFGDNCAGDRAKALLRPSQGHDITTQLCPSG
jgi:hypothetical protein